MISRRALARAVAAASVTCLVVASGAMSGSGSDATKAALDYIKDRKQELGLTGSDVKDVVVTDVVASKHNGVTHVYLQQQHKGIGVYNGIINVNVARDGGVLSAGNRFVPNLAAAAGGQSAKKAAVDAASAAADQLGSEAEQGAEGAEQEGRRRRRDHHLRRRRRAKARSRRSSSGTRPTARVRLAWSVRLDEADHWWNAFVDAETGAVARAARSDHPRGRRRRSARAWLRRRARRAPCRRSRRPTTRATASSRSRSRARATATACSCRTRPTRARRRSAGTTRTASPGRSSRSRAATTCTRTPTVTNDNVADPGSDPNGGPSLDVRLRARPDEATARLAAGDRDEPLLLEQRHPRRHAQLRLRRGVGELPGRRTTAKGGIGNDDVRAEAQDGSGRNNANFGTGRRRASARGCRCSSGARRHRTRSS